MTTMIRALLATAGAVATVSLASAQHDPSPYTDFREREIKALSADEISGLVEGHGMGLALPAELNSYPGPKHVLELSDSLGLDEDQLRATRSAFDVMHEKATRLGAEIVEQEGALDRLFATGAVEQASLRRSLERIASLRGRLRLAHLEAHLEMKAILSDEQIARYDALRGYGSTGDPAFPHAAGDPSE